MRCFLIAVVACAASCAPETPSEPSRGPATGVAEPPPYEPTPPEAFFDWTSLPFDPSVYVERRTQMLARLKTDGGGVLLVPARTGRSHGGTFRQLDDFSYFTGLELPDSVLVLDADHGTTTLFLPDVDSRFESGSRRNDFPGRDLGRDVEIRGRTRIEDTRSVGQFPTALQEWSAAGRVLRLSTREVQLPPIEMGWPHPRDERESLLLHLNREWPDLEIQSAFDAVAALRAIKGPAELAVIRRACEITADSMMEAAAFVRDGVDERTLEGELEAAFKRRGAQRRAFDSIIKSGPNSLWPWRILAAHYDRRNRTMHDGELVIFDVGCEWNQYSSDVGRTFPVSGRFTGSQRRRLEMITHVSDTVIAAVRPGLTLGDLQEVAEAEIPEAERPFMQTGLFFGHAIGLAVGDPLAPDAVLEPGMVFTVEPWYYNHVEELAVFIEDVVVVTTRGAENLTADLPRAAGALESMVGGV